MASSYATPSDLMLRYDSNLLGMLVNDNSQKIAPSAILNDPATQAALDDATGIINSALYVAYKYTASQIAGVTSESASLLKRLCCDLAVVMLCQRRGFDYSDKYPLLNLTLDIIERLRSGERVLDLAANESAGNTKNCNVTVVQQERAGLVVTNFRIFPMRSRGGEGLEW